MNFFSEKQITKDDKMKKKEGAVALIFNEAHTHILAIKRRDVPIWVLPGGGIDPQETPEEAIVREVFEETNLIVAIVYKQALYHPKSHLTQTTHLFKCRAIAGKIGLSNETKEIGFYPLNNLPAPFFFLHETWIKEALQNPGILVERPITEISYSTLFFYFFKHPLQVFRCFLSKIGLPWNS